MSENLKSDSVSQEEVSGFLDLLRETGAVNMFGATPYIMETYGVTKNEARVFLKNWMENFGGTT